MATLMSGISNVGSKEVHVLCEDAEHRGPQQVSTNQNGAVDSSDERRIVRKIDWCIMPVLMLLYTQVPSSAYFSDEQALTYASTLSLGFMDRVNLGNAAIAGMNTDLKLEGLQFNIAVALFYPLYILIDLLSNLILRFTRANLVLAGSMLAWGFVTLLIGFVVRNYTDLVVIRIFLGLTEGFILPASLWYITLWYPKEYWPVRMAFFFAAPTLAGGFGGLIGRGCSSIDHAIRPGWAFIFIIEGAVTILVGLAGMFLLPSSLESAKFLNARQRAIWAGRLHEDRGSRKETASSHHILAAFIDLKVILAGLQTLGK